MSESIKNPDSASEPSLTSTRRRVPVVSWCDGASNNCPDDVTFDNGCVCMPRSMASCYTGPPGTEGVGTCRAGTHTCNADGMAYGACNGDVTPTTEIGGALGRRIAATSRGDREPRRRQDDT